MNESFFTHDKTFYTSLFPMLVIVALQNVIAYSVNMADNIMLGAYSQEAFDEKLFAILATESWIIDGNYSRTLESRLKYCDTVFLLDYPVEVCLGGAYARLGKEREDIPWSENELEEEFRQFIEDFPKTKLPGIYKLLEQYGDGKEIHIFHSREEAERYLEG